VTSIRNWQPKSTPTGGHSVNWGAVPTLAVNVSGDAAQLLPVSVTVPAKVPADP